MGINSIKRQVCSIGCMNSKLFSFAPAIITSALNVYAQYGANIPNEVPVFISTVSPFIQSCLDGLFQTFCKKDLSNVECTRLGISYVIAVDGINEKTRAGAKLRPDLFFQGGDYSKASQIMESAIKATIDDTETIKSLCYGRFLANIPFDNSCDVTTLQSLNTIIKQLTYKELCLIKLLYDKSIVSSKTMEGYLRENEDVEGTILLNQLLHLQNQGILIVIPPYTLGLALGNLKTTPIGKLLFEMMELDLIPEDDLSDLYTISSRVGFV